MNFSAKELFAKGIDFYNVGDFKGALKIFNATLQLAPKNYDAYYFRGECYLRLQDYKQSRADFDKAKALDPNDAEFYFQYGKLSREENEILNSLNRAIAYNPNFAEAYLALGNKLRSMTSTPRFYIKETNENYKKAIELKPDYYEAYSDFAYSCIDVYGSCEDGIELFSNMIERNPDNVEAYRMRCLIYTYYRYGRNEDIDNLKNVINDCNKIIGLCSSDFLAYYYRGKAYRGLKKYELAIRDLTKSVEINPTWADAFEQRGKCFEAIGDKEQAQEDFSKADEIHFEQSIDKHSKLISRGDNFQQDNDLAAAIISYTRAIEYNPNYYLTYARRGETYFNMGDYVKAIEDYTRAIELQSSMKENYLCRGKCFELLEDRTQALGDYKKALELDGNIDICNKVLELDSTCVLAYKKRGVYFFKNKNYNQAFHDFDKVLETVPDDAESYKWRGEIYFELGDYETAIANYSKAFELNGNEIYVVKKRGSAYFRVKNYIMAMRNFNMAINFSPKDSEAYKGRGEVYFELGDYDAAIADFSKALELEPTDYEVYDKHGTCYQKLGMIMSAEADLKKNPKPVFTFTLHSGGDFVAGKKGETIGGLYLRIGLSYDELNQDFVNVEETLSANIQRLNRENRLINLKADIDLTRATDAAQKLKIQQESLTRQIDIQREKVKLYESEWIAAGKANGVGSQQAQKAAISLQQQTLVLARLEQKLKEIQSTQSALPKSDNPLLAGYKGIKGDVTGAIGNLTSAFTGLKDASSSVDSAITKSLEIIGNIPSPVGKAVAALASIPLIAKGIENSLLDMAKPAVEAGDKMYVMSRGMQLNVKDMAQLSTVAKVTGISIDEVNSSLRRFSAQITKAEGKDTLMNRTLKQYGLDVRDANGNIKQGIELAKVLSEGLQKAQAIGKGAEFRDIMGGRALWTGDFVTFLEDLNGNIETAGKIVKNGLANPTLAHEVQGNINAMNAQAAQMGGAFSSALMPVANELVPKITARMGELTKVIAENAAGIKNIGFAISSVVEITGNLTSAVVELGAKGAGVIGKAFTADTDALIDRYGVLNNQIKSADDLMAAEMRLKSPQERSGIENNPAISQQTFSYYQRQFQKIEEWRKKVGKSWADFRKEAGNPPFTINQPKVEGLEESLERIKKYSEELEKINLDLKFGDDTYGKSIAELDLWYDKALKGAKNFEEERNSLAELYGAKRAQIERQHDEEVAKAQEESGRRIRGLTEETASMQYERTHSAYEKQIYDIERWKERSIAAIKDKSNAEAEAAAITANAAEKASQAFAKEMDRIRGNIQSLEEKIFEQEHSHRDIDLLRVQKERAQYLKENYPADLVEHWYQGELRKIQERAAKDKDYLKSPSSSSGNSGFIMYGNQIDGSSPLITYGDKLNGASSMLIAYGNEPQQDFSPVKNFYDELKQSTDRRMEQYGNLGSVAENIATSLQGIDSPMQNFQKSLEDISASTGSISYQFDLVGSASEELANAFSQAAMTISEVKGSLSNTQVQYQSPNNEEFLDTRVAEVYSTFPNDTESGYNFSEVLATINASLQELMQLSSQNPTGINAATQELTEQLSQVLFSTAKAAELANNQQNITVSPTINVDLGGAYVFDDEMKQQLTDDITAEVANAVTSAVQDATSKANYGYGN